MHLVWDGDLKQLHEEHKKKSSFDSSKENKLPLYFVCFLAQISLNRDLKFFPRYIIQKNWLPPFGNFCFVRQFFATLCSGSAHPHAHRLLKCPENWFNMYLIWTAGLVCGEGKVVNRITRRVFFQWFDESWMWQVPRSEIGHVNMLHSCPR